MHIWTVSCALLYLQVRSLLVNPSATCASSTPTTTCSVWHSPPRLPPPGSTVRTLTPRTAGAGWVPHWASPWAAAAAAPVWLGWLRAASGWDRLHRRRANRHLSLTSGTSSLGKGQAQRQWYDEEREEDAREGKERACMCEVKNPKSSCYIYRDMLIQRL